MTDILYDPTVPYDANFYVRLACMINEEPAQPKDLQTLGMPFGVARAP